MSKKDIADLKKSISHLKKRWNELRVLKLAANSMDRKLEVLDSMDLINIRITRIETVKNHLEAGIITVAPPDEEDKKQISDALETLSKHVAKDMKWSAAVKLTKQILIAAHKINMNINGRQQKEAV